MENTQHTHEGNSPVDFDNLEFGKVFADQMVSSQWDGSEWSSYIYSPLDNLQMHPASSVLHYGQAIFEGLKAYKCADGSVNIFRLDDNLIRINASAERMMMPQLDVKKAKEAIMNYVASIRHWVPNRNQGSLYIRPFMISTAHTLRAVPSEEYSFMVIACPVGFYYDKPLSIYVEQEYRRAARGGIGYAKAAGNYAAAFYPTMLAKQKGYDQVLWTDVSNNYTLEELGSANFFFVKNNELFTPKLQDSILKGITRRTVMAIAESKGMVVREVEIPATDLASFLASGEVQCMFATGTAAAITYVNKITINESKYEVNSDSFQPVLDIKIALDALKFREQELDSSWNVVV